MDFPEHPFWDFSIKVHGHAGVHEACLAMQVDHAIDVNILFYCCWRGAAGGGPARREDLLRIMEGSSGWQNEIVRPVWTARRKLKPRFGDFPVEFTEPLRRALIAAELDAEHMEQLQIAALAPFEIDAAAADRVREADALENLTRYLFLHFEASCRAGGSAPPTVLPAGLKAPIGVLLRACFPHSDADALASLIDTSFSRPAPV